MSRIEEQIGKAVEWWNDRVDSIITPDIAKSTDQSMATFKWSQLVWQEIVMFIQLGKVDDLDWICNRRGFNKTQRKVLRDVLLHVGLL